jgi:hypothetical protein
MCVSRKKSAEAVDDHAVIIKVHLHQFKHTAVRMVRLTERLELAKQETKKQPSHVQTAQPGPNSSPTTLYSARFG